ncbi:uncharacterized protein LOC130799338 [Amaranthus tricolor]|uniref:uncharacterized protein LOC130799338 n=1 Tax=Amaranthus tricolor TaxID=29722 RepID=UPI002588A2B0|nr:uncharacterized protein LOC130799338 [Amaranthus tricolor]
MKSRTLDFFFKKSNGGQASILSVQNETHEQQQNPKGGKRNDIPTTNNNRPHKFVRVKLGDNVNHFVVERDPGLRKQINEYHPNDREKLMRDKVQEEIRKEIGEAKFCIILDESQDRAEREQMTIVLRFVDKFGILKEQFLDLVHVKNTASLTLKEELYQVFSYHNLNIKNVRGQGYDGASNMLGEFNGLKALISKDSPYAYYLMALLKDMMNYMLINQQSEIAHNVAHEGTKTGKGLNQIGNLQRATDTRWSSHLNSSTSLMRTFSATGKVLKTVIKEGNSEKCASVDAAYDCLMSFEFVFILHLMGELLGLTDNFCQAFTTSWLRHS